MTEMHTGLDVASLRTALARDGDEVRAEKMSGYMKGHFEFFGLPAPKRREAAATTTRAAKEAYADDIVAFVRRCWEQPEREFHYVGSDILGWNVAKLEPRHLNDLWYFVSTHSWWDTVDALAS